MKLGYVRDSHDPRDWEFATSSLMGVTRRSGAVDHSTHLDAVQDQIANDCVGHSIANAAYLGAQVSGLPIARPSPVFPWAIARLKAGPPPLRDEGCQFRNAMLGVATYGLVEAHRWPETPETLLAVPPLDSFEAGSSARVQSYYRISPGNDAPQHVVEALARGFCPVFGMTVDEAYENVGAKVYVPGGRKLGGHAQTVVGYDPVGDTFKVLNSWGASWGDGGFARIPASFFVANVFDCWVMTVLPGSIR